MNFAMQTRCHTAGPILESIHHPQFFTYPAAYDRNSVLKWWRTRPPRDFYAPEADVLRQTIAHLHRSNEADWSTGILHQIAVAVGFAIDRMKVRSIVHPEIDVALSAVLAFAIEGDPTAAVVLSCALRRRAYLDCRCSTLSALWLGSKGIAIS